ncbi:hypothetical protein [Flavobacterium reichenbachii]|uniref:Uncharacterized protein n=1 Tax=Flavobacterium reichenbachii TaxID=362418 RepID=A0A085ZFQ4_9FLAO|nr:hypothetical protein [Flavobacterium reichenbachii]KFF03268.1 hypothetical protein IW19_20430 [Flavobacterium reichenbachii]OXB15249.1 hypothetical protein B0A68_11040 [Flavobacterium reichenbachii]
MLDLILTITGARWQMTKILNIYPNMIRFFSLSQMIFLSKNLMMFFSIKESGGKIRLKKIELTCRI